MKNFDVCFFEDGKVFMYLSGKWYPLGAKHTVPRKTAPSADIVETFNLRAMFRAALDEV